MSEHKSVEARLETIEHTTKRLCDEVRGAASDLHAESEALEAKRRKQQEDLSAKAESLDAAHKVAMDGVATERAAFQSEQEAARDIRASHSTMVKLNIGGQYFTTSRGTLCKIKGSMLEAMFSGRHALELCDDGAYFIDRDPTFFRHILNFLRTGAVVEPVDARSGEELAVEADFYGLEPLVRALRAPPIDVQSALGEEIAASRAREVELRAQCAQLSSGAFVNGGVPAQSLISVFSDDGVTSSLTRMPDPMGFETLLGQTAAVQYGQRVVVGTMDDFQRNFNRTHSNMLNRLLPILRSEPVGIAGGSVLHALTAGQPLGQLWGAASDIDLFLFVTNMEETVRRAEATRICRRIWDAVAVDQERWMISRTEGIVEMQLKVANGYHDPNVAVTVQVVLRLYDSIAEVLLGFDCDCCCVAFDGNHVWALPRALRALRCGQNVLNPLHAWPQKPAYEMRLAKYALRGYAIVVPGLEPGKVDWQRIQRAKFDDLRGLARLLYIAFAIQADPRAFLHDMRPALAKIRVASLQQNTNLRQHILQLVGPAESIQMSGYDDIIEGEWRILPSAFPHHSVDHFYIHANAWPTAQAARGQAWREITDCHRPKRIPSQLDQAWDVTKRSREYLNAGDYQLDTTYYVQAYRDASRAGPSGLPQAGA